MKIRYRKGDLFATDIKTIVHGCNAQGVMGSGVAKIVKERYPEAFEMYKYAASMHTPKELMGKNIIWFGDKTIVNSVTQETYGRAPKRYVDYDAVRLCMNRIQTFFGDPDSVHHITEIAMPQIGAGLGGGDWNVIGSIIESELKTIRPVVYVLDN